MPLAYGQDFQYRLYRENYGPGETVQINLIFASAPIRVLTASSFSMEDATRRKISFSPFYLKRTDTFYQVYFMAPTNLANGSYNFIANDVLLSENGLLVEKDFAVPLTIVKYRPVLSVFPGFVFLNGQNDFTIKATTQRDPINVQITATAGVRNVYFSSQGLSPRTDRTFKFSLNNTYGADENVRIRYGDYSYTIPVIINQYTSNQSITGPALNQTIVTAEVAMVRAVDSIDRTLERDETVDGILELKNFGDTAVPLLVEVEGDIKDIVSIDAPETLVPNVVMTIAVTLNKNKAPLADEYEGRLVLRAGTLDKTIPMHISFKEKTEELPAEPRNESKREPPKEPAEEPDQIFEFNYTYGTKTEEKQTRAGLIVFIIILIAAAIALYLFTRKTTKKESFDEYIKSIEKK